MARRTFLQRSQTFGYDTTDPWAADAFRLLFNVPRAYRPLVDAWDRRYPGTLRALRRLVDLGFVAHQPPVVIDTRAGVPASQPSRRLDRYVTTAKGVRLLADVDEDLRYFEDRFPRTATYNVRPVVKLLSSFHLDGSHARFGLSVPHAATLCGLPERNVRWWVAQFEKDRLIRRLDEQYADVREVVPEHWRVTRLLCRQLADVLTHVDGAPAELAVEFRLGRARFLDDVEPARVGISGATDFDHDVTAQQVLARLLGSSRCAADGIFTVEPRLSLPADTGTVPWRFDRGGDTTVFYQPDAEFREVDEEGQRRSVVEYERYQTRRDAWGHIQRFLGYLHVAAFPQEAAVLRFVVDTDSRVRSYVTLIEAFADHAIGHPDTMPPNPVTLAVSSVPRVLAGGDALDLKNWFRIALPPGDGAPVLHSPHDSPYDEYFARG